MRATIAVLSVLASALFAGALLAASAAPQSETVVITLRAKPGAEAELARVIEQHWAVARQLKLVNASPHLTLRQAEEGNKTRFTEIFAWRDASTPDHAPAAIQAIWSQMNSLVETRGGQPGLDIATVSILSH